MFTASVRASAALYFQRTAGSIIMYTMPSKSSKSVAYSLPLQCPVNKVNPRSQKALSSDKSFTVKIHTTATAVCWRNHTSLYELPILNPDVLRMQSLTICCCSAEMAIHAELNLPAVKINAYLVLRELPRKLLLPIFHLFTRHRSPWPWHREPCPALSFRSPRRSLWCPTPS